MSQVGESFFVCESCGKRFRWKPTLAGKRVKCPCGHAVSVPAEIDLVFADEAIDAPPLIHAPPAAPQTKSRPVPDAAALAANLGIALPTPKRGKTEAELALEERGQMEEMAKPSILRDVVIPIPIIVAGLILYFTHARYWHENPARTAAGAIATVIIGATLAVGIMLFAMWMLTTLFDVNFMGSFKNCILRLAAIAIGPAALHGIIVFHMGGDGVAGGFLGAIASVAAYGALFWALMRVDAKDAFVCTIVTFGLVMLANYIGFRIEGMLRGSDI